MLMLGNVETVFEALQVGISNDIRECSAVQLVLEHFSRSTTRKFKELTRHFDHFVVVPKTCSDDLWPAHLSSFPDRSSARSRRG